MLQVSLDHLANVPGVSILSLLTPIKPAKDLNWKAAVSVDGSIADNTPGAEPATGGDYASHKHIEAQCDHNNTVEFRAVPAQSGKENGDASSFPR